MTVQLTIFHHGWSWFKRKFMSIVNTLQFLGWTAQFVIVVGLAILATCVLSFQVPYMHEDETVVYWLRAVLSIVVFEVYLQWLCLKLVNNTYRPFKHGAIPEGVSLGQKLGVSESDNEPQHVGNGISNGKSSVSDVNEYGDLIRVRNTANDAAKKNTMYVATEFPKEMSDEIKRTAFPYFSWAPCLMCNRPRPPRCHHCPVCDACVLKRDHHCFVTGVCVGYRNLRYFVTFLFWAVVATSVGLYYWIPYYYYETLKYTSIVDLFFPIAIIRAALGYIRWQHPALIALLWLLTLFFIWSLGFFVVTIKNIKVGKTTKEVEFNIDLKDIRTLSEKIESVFGKYWLLNFLVPTHFVFEPKDDPVKWPFIKTY